MDLYLHARVMMPVLLICLFLSRVVARHIDHSNITSTEVAVNGVNQFMLFRINGDYLYFGFDVNLAGNEYICTSFDSTHSSNGWAPIMDIFAQSEGSNPMSDLTIFIPEYSKCFGSYSSTFCTYMANYYLSSWDVRDHDPSACLSSNFYIPKTVSRLCIANRNAAAPSTHFFGFIGFAYLYTSSIPNTSLRFASTCYDFGIPYSPPPSRQPTIQPTVQPSMQPTIRPTIQLSIQPTLEATHEEGEDTTHGSSSSSSATGLSATTWYIIIPVVIGGVLLLGGLLYYCIRSVTVHHIAQIGSQTPTGNNYSSTVLPPAAVPKYATIPSAPPDLETPPVIAYRYDPTAPHSTDTVVAMVEMTPQAPILTATVLGAAETISEYEVLRTSTEDMRHPSAPPLHTTNSSIPSPAYEIIGTVYHTQNL